MPSVLNHHLQATAVTKSEFKCSLDAMQKKIDMANSDANKSKQMSDRLVTKLNKTK